MRTVGVEEELLLLDADSGRPAAVAASVLERAEELSAARPGGIEGELQQQQLEIETAPSTSLAELGAQLREWRRSADDQAAGQGARVAALGTSPLPVDPELTPTPRYRRMAQHFGLTTVEQLTCGCHVHVSVADDDEGVAVLDRIRVWLPVLLALSVNSPFWQGADSGYASFRSQAWARFPSAGPTERFGSPAGYRERTAALLGSGVVLDEGMIYFDARLSHRYPTIEIRVADVCLAVDDSVLLAGLARALVETGARDATDGRPAPDRSADDLRLATWRAGRSGLEGHLLDPYDGRPRVAREVVAQLLDHVTRAASDAGDLDLITAGLERRQRDGSGADEQRRLAGSGPPTRALTLAAADLTVGRLPDPAG